MTNDTNITVTATIDTDELAEKLAEQFNVDDIAEAIAGSINAQDVATYIDMSDLAAALDYSDIEVDYARLDVSASDVAARLDYIELARGVDVGGVATYINNVDLADAMQRNYGDEIAAALADRVEACKPADREELETIQNELQELRDENVALRVAIEPLLQLAAAIKRVAAG